MTQYGTSSVTGPPVSCTSPKKVPEMSGDNARDTLTVAVPPADNVSDVTEGVTVGPGTAGTAETV